MPVTWNHRVVQEPTPDGDWYTIREVYYNEDKTIWGATSDGVRVGSDTVDGLRWTLEQMLRALDAPIIDAADIPAPQ